MKKISKFLGLIPAFALSAALTFGAGAQGIVNDVIDGAERIVGDTVDTADDILTGDGRTIGNSANDDSIVDNTQDADIPDQMEDDVVDNPNGSKNENDVTGTHTNEEDPNPGTGIGIPFMTAGLVAVSAAGVAYLARKRNEENGTESE